MKKLLALLALAATTLLTGCGGTIEQGNAGLVFDWQKKFSGTEVAGFYWKPFSRVDEYTLKEINVPINDLRPKAKDNLSMADLDVDVMYRVTSPDALARLALKRTGQSTKFDGADYFAPAFHYVRSTAESRIADAVSEFDSLKIHQNRDELAKAIKEKLQASLDAEDKGDFQITRVIVRRAVTDQSVEDSIRKVVNKQKEKEAADLEEGIQQALARANERKTAGLSPSVLQEKYLDAMKACASNQHCTMIIDGTSSQKMLNLGK